MTEWIRRALAAGTAGVLVCATGIGLQTELAGQTPLVFQTTFACADWDQAMGLGDSVVCSTGDGIAGLGGWTTSAGDRDQITATANNPAGGGGKGFRHWRGDGQNNNGGGLQIELPAPATEVWVRFYMRYQSGFKWANNEPQYTKDHYWNIGQNGQFTFGFSSGAVYLHTYRGTVTNMRSSQTWSSIMGGSAGDGKFHCYEYHVRMDTNGANGIAEIWYEGTKVLSLNNVNWNDGGGARWSYFGLGENQYNPTNGGSMYTDYDDIAVSTTGYIGPLVTLSRPAAPTNVQIIR